MVQTQYWYGIAGFQKVAFFATKTGDLSHFLRLFTLIWKKIADFAIF